jgi:hypothetical protein
MTFARLKIALLRALGRIEARLDTGGKTNSGGGGSPPFQVGNPTLATAGLTLSTGEIQLIRETLKPVSKGTPPQFRVGDPLQPGIFVGLLPNSITSKFPRLSGLFYFIDRSGAVMLVAIDAKIIVAIVTPA